MNINDKYSIIIMIEAFIAITFMVCFGIYFNSKNKEIDEVYNKEQTEIDSAKKANDIIIIEINNIDSLKDVKVREVKNLDNDSTIKLFYELIRE